jgi:predicted thioesterase
MKDTLKPGSTETVSIEIDRERTIDFMGERARVYATPMLVRRHLDPSEDSVGTRIEIDHTAATLAGMKVELKVTIVEVKGRSVLFEVEGRDSVDPICRGRHQRFVVDVEMTEARLAAKARKAGLA